MHPATYRICLEGALPDEELDELVGMRVVERTRRTTVLEGVVPDQAALLGAVVRIEELGCRVRDLHVLSRPAAETWGST